MNYQDFKNTINEETNGKNLQIENKIQSLFNHTVKKSLDSTAFDLTDIKNAVKSMTEKEAKASITRLTQIISVIKNKS